MTIISIMAFRPFTASLIWIWFWKDACLCVSKRNCVSCGACQCSLADLTASKSQAQCIFWARLGWRERIEQRWCCVLTPSSDCKMSEVVVVVGGGEQATRTLMAHWHLEQPLAGPGPGGRLGTQKDGFRACKRRGWLPAESAGRVTGGTGMQLSAWGLSSIRKDIFRYFSHIYAKYAKLHIWYCSIPYYTAWGIEIFIAPSLPIRLRGCLQYATPPHILHIKQYRILICSRSIFWHILCIFWHIVTYFCI